MSTKAREGPLFSRLRLPCLVSQAGRCLRRGPACFPPLPNPIMSGVIGHICFLQPIMHHGRPSQNITPFFFLSYFLSFLPGDLGNGNVTYYFKLICSRHQINRNSPNRKKLHQKGVLARAFGEYSAVRKSNFVLLYWEHNKLAFLLFFPTSFYEH